MYLSIPVPLGSIPELAAVSCEEIKASEGQVVSDKYWLSTIKPGTAVFAYCDMKTGGGFCCTLRELLSCSLPFFHICPALILVIRFLLFLLVPFVILVSLLIIIILTCPDMVLYRDQNS